MGLVETSNSAEMNSFRAFACRNEGSSARVESAPVPAQLNRLRRLVLRWPRPQRRKSNELRCIRLLEVLQT